MRLLPHTNNCYASPPVAVVEQRTEAALTCGCLAKNDWSFRTTEKHLDFFCLVEIKVFEKRPFESIQLKIRQHLQPRANNAMPRETTLGDQCRTTVFITMGLLLFIQTVGHVVSILVIGNVLFPWHRKSRLAPQPASRK